MKFNCFTIWEHNFCRCTYYYHNTMTKMNHYECADFLLARYDRPNTEVVIKTDVNDGLFKPEWGYYCPELDKRYVCSEELKKDLYIYYLAGL